MTSLYSDLPDDLNASLVLPQIDAYLEERFDEEFNRMLKKKSAESYTSVNDLEVDDSFYFIDNESVINLMLDNSFLDSCDITINNDLILDEIHTKEGGKRIEFSVFN